MTFPKGIVRPKRTTREKKFCIKCNKEFYLRLDLNGKYVRRRPWSLDNDHCCVKCMKD